MPEIDLSLAPNRIVESLQLLVADLYSLTALAHNLHWNVEGPNFTEYHEFFSDAYTSNFENSDVFSEQIRQLGSYAKADLALFKQLAGMPEISAPFTGMQAFAVLQVAYEKYAKDLEDLKQLSGKFNDLNTQQLVIDEQLRISKALWMIKSFQK